MSRGEDFVQFLRDLLSLTSLSSEEIELLTDEDNIQVYEQAFTSRDADPEKNYEILEWLGDGTLNKVVVWYLIRRFPDLICDAGLPVLDPMKFKLWSNETLADIATKLGFEQYINRITSQKTIADVFEAFIGATEMLVDENIGNNLGYSICYQLLASLFNQIDLEVQHLTPRQKVYLIRKQYNLPIIYKYFPGSYERHRLYLKSNGKLIGKGSTKEKANIQALQYLHNLGYQEKYSVCEQIDLDTLSPM